MESLITLLNTLSSLSPLAVIALLGLIIFLLVKQHEKVDNLKGNDLHTIESKLDQMLEVMQRIEVDLSWVKARINGGPRV